MAFITGVDLEGRLPGGETRLALLKKKRPPRRRQQLELEDGGWQLAALCDEPKPVSYGDVLKSAVRLEGGDDPLEELRRRIKRTRGKMDAQNQVMDGFLNEVRQINASHRSFSATELSRPGSPAGVPALTAGQSSKALCSGSSGTELVPRRPTSASNASTAIRNISLRSDSVPARQLGGSRSTPALTAAAAGSLHQAAPLTLPQRRAPPGAPSSDLQKDISSATAARRRALAANAAAVGDRPGSASGMSKRLSHLGRSASFA